jgi:hypothetical protein
MEERLRIAEDQLQLVAEVFGLHAFLPPAYREQFWFSGACSALAEVYHGASQDLGRFRVALPADILNWSARAATQRRR